MNYLSLMIYSILAETTLAQPGITDPISEVCGPSVICVNHYANVLPYHFHRNISTLYVPSSFGDTAVNGTTLPDVKAVDFVVFDQKRGLEILGPNPSHEFMFTVSYAVHEAPVFVESLNKLFLSQLSPPSGYLPQLVIDLNQDPPTLSEYLSNPPLPCASYRYNQTSGAVFVVDDSLGQPNGIAFNPEGSIVYIGDSAGYGAPVNPEYGPSGSLYDATRSRTVYAFDISEDGTRALNKHPIYLAPGFIPDGLKVAANGYIVTAVGRGVDVLDPSGQLLVTIQTNYTVQNFAWTGPELKTLWLVGSGGISKVEWELAGQALK
ncbi:hypothetical protein FE257_010167 [Aspergillus nanangensis]|uniref:SMP-30/Gluconolactonase/LRE-like region domain-containing protein n=1 Tax=Aspergillus nanangensis TaxID=2582783 RepID=A0AAD4CJ45_ASPNN|nr:hypothetical protein FE257_010167 [Aspergillus nanangensis]